MNSEELEKKSTEHTDQQVDEKTVQQISETPAQNNEQEISIKTDRTQDAKRYESIHNRLFLLDILITVASICAFLFLGGSTNLRTWIELKISSNPWIIPLFYALIITVVYYFVLLIPLHYIDYYFENKFKLSTQSFASWLADNFKSLALNLLLLIIFLESVYFLLRFSPNFWWLFAALFWILFGILLSNLAPILLIPLFYKLKPLTNQSLKQKLTELAEKVQTKILGIFEIGLSAKTVKANAMLAGLGNTKRIILGDTLIKNYSNDEIEIVIAHELGHHYHKHPYKLILLGSIVTIIGFLIAHYILVGSISLFSDLEIRAIHDVAAFPLLLLAFFIFALLTMPFNNAYSRQLEREADKFTLRLTDKPEVFINTMKKLADQNLADMSPSPLIEFLLHSHPSASKRIKMAEKFIASKK